MYSRGVETHHDPSREDTAAILVIAGTRHLRQLRQAKKRGIRIIQRLNGMNWTHHKVHTGLKHYVRAETYNWLLSTIRQSLADTVSIKVISPVNGGQMSMAKPERNRRSFITVLI